MIGYHAERKAEIFFTKRQEIAPVPYLIPVVAKKGLGIDDPPEVHREFNLNTDLIERGIFKDDIDKVAEALRAGANPDLMNRGTLARPLCAAARGGNVEIAALLIGSGADVNGPDYPQFYAPIAYAALRGHGPMVAFLLGCGADPNWITGKNQTPTTLAEGEKDEQQIVSMCQNPVTEEMRARSREIILNTMTKFGLAIKEHTKIA